MSDATAENGRTMHDRAAELLEGYVLEALDPPETAVVDEHLDDGCEDCEEELGILRRVVQALPLGSRWIAPREGLRDQILEAALAVSSGQAGSAVQADAPSAQLQRRDSAPIPMRRRPLQALAGSFGIAAGFGMIALGGLLAWAVVLQTQVDDLQSENSSLVSTLSATESRIESNMASLIWTASDGDMLQFVSESGTSARARLLWDSDAQLFVIGAMGLNATQDAGAYGVWVDGVKLATLHVGETGASFVEGYTQLRLADAAEITITREDDPEATEPTGATVLTLVR